MKLEQKRWLILLAGFLSNLCQGIAYASSIFMAPIISAFNIDKPQAALAFSLIIACLPIGTIIGGVMSSKKGPRGPIVLGSVIFALGLILASFTIKSQNLMALYITYGCMLGVGSGFAYGSIVGTVTQWFPDKRGLAGGLVVAALGGGPVVLTPIMVALLDAAGLQMSFLILGIVFAVVMIGAALVVVAPPKDFVPEGFVAKTKAPADGEAKAPAKKTDFIWSEMLKTLDFWVLFVLFFAGTFGGLMIISKAKPLCEAVLENLNVAEAGALAASGVMIIAACNALGRLFWGAVSDKLGRMPTLMIMFAVQAVLMAVINMMGVNFVLFLIGLAITGLCFGGYLGMFPALCADFFGIKNVTLNFGILFAAFAVSGVFAPIIGAKFDAVTGYHVAAVIAAVGFFISMFMLKRAKK
ncbi:MAG: OFA family MFS transporter [Abditibacteriota bacterium]|nr:OFA family MFS transporter [Abditibacteriota bacterium]